MGTITTLLVALSFVSGCVTLFVGYQVGHGTAPLITHLGWGIGTLLLQFAATCVALMHTRAERRYVSALEEALESARARVETGGSA